MTDNTISPPIREHGEGVREAIAQALAMRFIERGKRRGSGAQWSGLAAMPKSYSDDFYEDADAVLAALSAQPVKDAVLDELTGLPVLEALANERKAHDDTQRAWVLRDAALREAEAKLAALSPKSPASVGIDPDTFQARVAPWMQACFGIEISADVVERNHRFLEESLELVQSTGCTASEAHQLVDYVYGRPTGEPSQEVGGVMVTLAALCLAADLDMHSNGETELARIWTKVEQIRAKQAAKPKHSPLPEALTLEDRP